MAPNPIMFGGTPTWAPALAAIFGGLSAAGQPGGFANFGMGAQQGQQNFQQGQQNQQQMDLRRMQIEQAQEEMRRANQEREQEQALIDRLRSLGNASGSSTTPVTPVGNYGASTGGIQTASGPAPLAAMFQSDPQLATVFNTMLDARDVKGAIGLLSEIATQEPDKPKAGSEIGQIMADVEAGFITPEQAQERIAKMNYIAPQQGPGLTERQRNALAAGLKEGSPEYQQYILGRDDTAPGVFQGTGLDAQSYNIVLEGTKNGQTNTPEYAAAYANLAMPKVTTDPVTGKSVYVQPDMSWAVPPVGRSTAQDAPLPEGATSQQVPGATITTNPGAPIYNETQGKAAGFADRISAANEILDATQSAGTDEVQRRLGQLPLVGNYAMSSDRQKFEQAERDFINAILRRESGAVISEEEFANARQQYLPQPGDSEQVLAQKKASRDRALNSMQREGGPFYKPDAANDPLGIR
jgi:hypothetical protein